MCQAKGPPPPVHTVPRTLTLKPGSGRGENKLTSRGLCAKGTGQCFPAPKSIQKDVLISDLISDLTDRSKQSKCSLGATQGACHSPITHLGIGAAGTQDFVWVMSQAHRLVLVHVMSGGRCKNLPTGDDVTNRQTAAGRPSLPPDAQWFEPAVLFSCAVACAR